MSDKVKLLNDLDFEKTIKESKVPVLVDFFAKWCAPCRMQAPVLDELANDLDGKALIAKIDIDECESLAIKYGVSSIPCLMVFKNGELKETSVGLQGKAQLAAMLIRHI